MEPSLQLKVNATYMRGGTSKGVFFKQQDLPEAYQYAGTARDNFLLRVLGSPDPYGKQIDGMGGASSSTSKAVIVAQSEREGHDVDYTFAQVSINKALVDWSGNCGNLTAAVGVFALFSGLVNSKNIPKNGLCKVRIWQKNIAKTIVVHVPIKDGLVQELGDFYIDGIAFPSAKIQVDFIKPVDNQSLLPTGNAFDSLAVPKVGTFNVTLISAGIPCVILQAQDFGYNGAELSEVLNQNQEKLKQIELIRQYAAVKMGLSSTLLEAESSQHIPKIIFVAPALSYLSASGEKVLQTEIDLTVRAVSMGIFHHALMGTASVALAVASAISGTLVHSLVKYKSSSLEKIQTINLGHSSGTLDVCVDINDDKGDAFVNKVTIYRSARVLMQGQIYIPQ